MVVEYVFTDYSVLNLYVYLKNQIIKIIFLKLKYNVIKWVNPKIKQISLLVKEFTQ